MSALIFVDARRQSCMGGGSAYLDPLVASEPIELIQQFQHGPLNLSISRLVRVESLRSDGVELVDEDDGRCLFLGELESVSDELGTISDEHLESVDGLRKGIRSRGGFGKGVGCRVGKVE
jgi:hypothetical protein